MNATPPPLGSGDRDLPYEDVPGGPIDQPASNVADQLAGSIVVAAISVDLETGRYPGLVFTFTDPEGADLPRTMLVLDHERMARVPGLIGEAVAAALRETR